MEDSLLTEYIVDRSSLDIPNYKRENSHQFVRYTPSSPNSEGLIYFTQIEEDEIDLRIEEQVAYFKQYCNEFEWKVYDFDCPANLKTKLQAHGFAEGNEEALMVFDLSQYQQPAMQNSNIFDIRRIDDLSGIHDVVSVQEKNWGRSFLGLSDHLKSSLETTVIFCAYVNDNPIATGWIDYAKNSKFAEIHGGAVIAKYRGQGIYSRLFNERMNDAKMRGVQYITVDAGAMSRPILERKGFVKLAFTFPMTKGVSS